MLGIRPILLAGLGAALLSQAQQPPTFRTRVDVVRLDVTVLDKDRHPVTDLTQGDFTILVDGVPQPISSFERVTIPPAAPVTTEWMREVAPDVRSNALGEPRLIVLLMDDATTPTDPYMVENGKKIARRIIDELSPSDLAAVVFTMDNSHAQDFTSDHRLLRAAVDHFGIGMRGNPLAGRYSQKALAQTVAFLRQRAHGRNAVMLITSSPVGSTEVHDNSFATALTEAARTHADLREVADIEDAAGGAARFAPVPIYGFNIAGVVAANPPAAVSAGRTILRELPYTDVSERIANEIFRTLADMTGGRAIVHDNDPARMVPAVIQEMSAYYTIAYRATYVVPEEKTHRLQIRVNRPGVLVLPSERTLTTERPRPAPAAAPPPLLRAIAELVPMSELPMAVTTAPFLSTVAGRSGKPATPVVLITLRVRRIAPPDRATDEIQVLAKVFTPEGKAVKAVRQNASLKLRAADGDAQLDVLTAIPLRPGRYNLRLSAHSVALDKTGSVYTDVTVPAFTEARLALSGVLLTASPSALAAPKDAFSKVVPVMPTSDREFTVDTGVRAFLRIYQPVKRVAPIDVAIRVIDAQGQDAARKTERIDAGQFVSGSADVTCDLPLKTLPPGSYLLSIIATLDAKTSAQRDVRFSVR